MKSKRKLDNKTETKKRNEETKRNETAYEARALVRFSVFTVERVVSMVPVTFRVSQSQRASLMPPFPGIHKQLVYANTRHADAFSEGSDTDGFGVRDFQISVFTRDFSPVNRFLDR